MVDFSYFKYAIEHRYNTALLQYTPTIAPYDNITKKLF